MRLAVLVVALSFATPALAADEEPPPDPRTGGPLVVIPVEMEDVTRLVVTDVSFEPDAGLTPGSSVRLRAQLAAGAAPDRTVIVIDDFGEIEGDVVVAADGTIDHDFVLPSGLAPGEYPLVLSATGLGRALLGVIDVVVVESPAALAPAAAGGIGAPADQATTSTAAPAAARAAADLPPPGTTGVPLPLVVAAAALVGLAMFWVLSSRRRRGAVASFASTTALPTATSLPGHHAPARTAGAPARPADSNGAEPAAPAEPVDRADPMADAAPDPAHAFHVIELTAGSDATSPPVERIIGSFSTVEAAKSAARDRRRDTTEKNRERWWEVRPTGRGAVWMVHAWALREYDIDDATGHVSSTQG